MPVVLVSHTSERRWPLRPIGGVRHLGAVSQAAAIQQASSRAVGPAVARAQQVARRYFTAEAMARCWCCYLHQVVGGSAAAPAVRSWSCS